MSVETIRSVERASCLLRLLASERRYMPLGEVAESVGLAKGSAYGLLQTLVRERLVEHDARTGRYRAVSGVSLPPRLPAGGPGRDL